MGQRKGTLEDMVMRWRGRRVFVTGHTGFKGGWLSLWLAEMGAHVRGYALDVPTVPSFFEAAELKRSVEDIRGDILDRKKLETSVSEFAPDVVFHLAAQPLVRQSYADPVTTYMTNVIGTAHVLEAVRMTSSVRAVVCVTTDKCYENREWAWPYRESDALGGFDPYSSSKACAEILSSAYRSSFFSKPHDSGQSTGVATARAGNVIGGGDWSSDRLVPDLIRGFLARQPVRIRRPASIRPWQHVLEPLKGYLLLAEHLLSGRLDGASAYNFGPSPESTWPVDRVADYMVASWGKEASWTGDPDSGPHEAGTLRLDSSKAHSELGWRPKLSISQSLDWTVSWYRAWSDGDDMRQVTLDQIAKYELTKEG